MSLRVTDTDVKVGPHKILEITCRGLTKTKDGWRVRWEKTEDKTK